VAAWYALPHPEGDMGRQFVDLALGHSKPQRMGQAGRQ
jgi:hypothetical protein